MTTSFLNVLMIFSLVGVVCALGSGLFFLFKGGDLNKKYSNKAMGWRVLLQGFAILLFFLIIYASR